ncbi:ATP-binding protein [Haloarchaeobius sp. DYHT-AS-18]|uniref:DEAD/DEAH box helicase family protein n=1 Tax=Haloarchaeobius sp. DYHT-AS-18 TaxID=3446117 RepID=UPI003EC06AB2
MNLAFAAQTGWGKTYVSHSYIEQNAADYDVTIVLDYKDEYSGLVETGYLKRMTAPRGSENITPKTWQGLVTGVPGLQIVRHGMTDEQWQQLLANLIVGLEQMDLSVFLVLDEAHRFAPQSGSYPEEISTLATTYHGDGFGVCWMFQRFAKLDKDVLSCCTASMLGGFQTTNDIDQLDTIEYDADVHLETRTRVPHLPDDLLVDGEPLALRRWLDNDEKTIGSEWIYTDGKSTQRLDSRNFEMESRHYGSDRKQIKHPF